MVLSLWRKKQPRPAFAPPQLAPAPRSVRTDPAEHARLQALADSVKSWWHSIDFGQGVVTPGHKTPECIRAEVVAFRLPDLWGKTVLDVGAWDGAYSFEAERRGASRVVALDHYVWSLDLDKTSPYWKKCQGRGHPAQGVAHHARVLAPRHAARQARV